ncbi:hypothetical protein IIA79_00865 [bacterium]|nr:hypothetical protein [bacterium]
MAAKPAGNRTADSAEHSAAPGASLRVSLEQYAELLEQMAVAARSLHPAPDAVVGIKRSGLFPAVYLSHKLELPLFTAGETGSFPFPRLKHPLLVDTAAWTGKSLRKVVARLESLGVERVAVLVMYARSDPRPKVRGLHYLELTDRIVHFWYEKGRVQQDDR